MADFRVAAQEYDPAIPIESIREHPENYNQGDVGAIHRSMARHGFYGGVIVQRSTGRVLAGNHRYRAAIQAGAGTVPGFWLDVDDDEAEELLVDDNWSSHLATFDEPQLLAVLQRRAQHGQLPATIDPDDIDDLIKLVNGDERPTDDARDRTPPVPVEPVSRPGDLWLLGPHRLLVGDGTSLAAVEQVTRGLGAVTIVYTDPPYGIRAVPKDGGVSRGGRFGGKTGGGEKVAAQWFPPVTGDESTDTVQAAFQLLTAKYPKARHAWWGANHYAATVGAADASCWLVWDKDNHGNDFADCELAWTNHPGAVRLLKHMWNGMLRASERNKRVHPTQKPAALAVWAFSVLDPRAERQVVLDVFAGSGSTLIAAHETNRTAALIEIEPAYADVIARRWQEHTGVTPERATPDGSAEPFDFTTGGQR